MKSHPGNGGPIRRQDDAKTIACVYNVVMKWLINLWNRINKYPLLADGLLAMVIGLLAFYNLSAYWDIQPPPIHTFLAGTLIACLIIPLIWRRLFPSITLLIITVAMITLWTIKIPEMNFGAIPLLIAIFSAAAYGGNKRNLVCGVCIIALLGGLVYMLMFSGRVTIPISLILYSTTTLIYNLMIFLGIWWLGTTLRKSREQTSQLRENAEQLLREREDNARRAVFDERIRIARELHDVLAHHVSVMGIQAGAARQVLKQYPEKALNSLSLIEKSSRQAVSELYRLLDLLRDEKQVESFTSQPGLQQLDKLISDMDDAGLQVEVKIEGEKREIPQLVDLSAYRILEEALTNTLKHAKATKAVISMIFQNGTLILDITDNGHGIPNEGKTDSGGKGLIGMRERVNLVKGEFQAGNDPNGGFRIKVKLPLGDQR